MNFLEAIGVKPSRRDLKRQEAQRVMEKAEGMKILQQLTTELRENGDDSAVVVEAKKGVNINHAYLLALRWNLSKRRFLGEFNTWWDSKGVGIRALSSGEIAVGLAQQDSWYDLDGNNTNLHPAVLANLQDFLKQDRSLEEKVRFAMSYSQMHRDYRFGSGDRSLKKKPVESRFENRVF